MPRRWRRRHRSRPRSLRCPPRRLPPCPRAARLWVRRTTAHRRHRPGCRLLPAKPAPANKDQAKLVEKAQQQEKKASEAETRERAAADKKKAEQDAVAQKKAEADKRQADKLAKERAEREAEIAKKNQQASHKSSDDKKSKALVEAAARLKEAQSAYEEELQKAKGGAEPAPNSTTAKTATPSSSKQ